MAALVAGGPDGSGLGLLYTECTGTGMFYGFGYILMADPMLSCSDLPVSYGAWAVQEDISQGRAMGHGTLPGPSVLSILTTPFLTLFCGTIRQPPAPRGGCLRLLCHPN